MRAGLRCGAWVVLLGLVCEARALGAPPATAKRPVTESMHGRSFTDDYRWLEGDNSDPAAMGKMTDEVAAWTDAQNAYTRGVLDAISGRAAYEARLRRFLEVGSVSAPIMARDNYFYGRREGTQPQSVVMVRHGLSGEPRVLIDPNMLDAKGLVTVSWYVPSQDGTLLAFGLYKAGDENSTLYVMDVESGAWLADEIPGKVSFLGWMPDGKGFFYRPLRDVSNPYSGEVRYHTLGNHWRQDPLLVSQLDLEALYAGSGYDAARLQQLSTTYGPWAAPSRDGRWLQIGYSTDTRNNDLWVADLDLWFRTGELRKTPVVVGEQAASSGNIVGDTLYLETNLGAPNGRVFKVDLNNPARDEWVEIIPERQDAVLKGVSLARGLLAAEYLKNASSVIELTDLDGAARGHVELPNIGSAGLVTSDDRTEAFLTFTSFNAPYSIYHVDLTSGERTLWDRLDVPVDPDSMEVKQVWYTSKDGTRISMFVVHKKGLRLDGNNPTILYGYGGFNISMTPSFSSTMYTWVEDGGVYAVANLRGGGEYGKAWHEAGRLDRKQNVFDDFISAGEWLIDNKYTTPARLACSGGSNGGLLVGAAVTQRPDLFKAAICGVPLLDMLRYQDFLMARYWVPEYGSAEDPAQFEYIARYSPYQNIRQGVKYPAMIITAGENDARVHPMHARKMAAALQGASVSDQDAQPILLWVDRDAGHGGGKPLDLRVRDAADQQMFLRWQLGLSGAN